MCRPPLSSQRPHTLFLKLRNCYRFANLSGTFPVHRPQNDVSRYQRTEGKQRKIRIVVRRWTTARATPCGHDTDAATGRVVARVQTSQFADETGLLKTAVLVVTNSRLFIPLVKYLLDCYDGGELVTYHLFFAESLLFRTYL